MNKDPCFNLHTYFVPILWLASNVDNTTNFLSNLHFKFSLYILYLDSKLFYNFLQIKALENLGNLCNLCIWYNFSKFSPVNFANSTILTFVMFDWGKFWVCWVVCQVMLHSRLSDFIFHLMPKISGQRTTERSTEVIISKMNTIWLLPWLLFLTCKI